MTFSQTYLQFNELQDTRSKTINDKSWLKFAALLYLVSFEFNI